MSLVSNISAVVTQIGANLKALTARVTALETPTIPVRVISATTYTLAATDAGYELQFPNGCTVTLDTSVLTATQIGLLRQTGTAAVTVVKGGSTTDIFPSAARVSAGKGYLMLWRCGASNIGYVNGETA